MILDAAATQLHAAFASKANQQRQATEQTIANLPTHQDHFGKRSNQLQLDFHNFQHYVIQLQRQKKFTFPVFD